MITSFSMKIDDRTNGFLQMDNRVVEDNYTDLSVEAYMVLTRCLANISGWQINWKHFQKKYNITNNKRLSALKELISKGHCVMDSWKNGKAWEYNYVFFEIALSEEELEEFTQKILPELRNRNLEFKNKDSKIRILKSAQYIIYNNINKTNLKNNNSTKNTYVCVSEENFKNNININDSSCETCDMDSPNEMTFSEKHDSNDELGNFGGVTNLNNSQQSVTNPPKVKNGKQFKVKKADGTVSKNKMEYQMSQESKSLSEINGNAKGALGKQTDEESALAQSKRLNNQVQETLKEINAKKNVSKKAKQKRENEIFTLIEQDFKDDMKVIVHDYFDFLIQDGRQVYAANYRSMIRILEDLSEGDEKKKRSIVEQSLSRGWQGFYPLLEMKNNTKNNSKTVQPILIPADEEEPEEIEYRDENGNLITF